MDWYRQVVQKWSASIAHVFVLHGNTTDVFEGKDMVDFLVGAPLCVRRDVVICYNRSTGITFPLPSHRDKFYQLLSEDVPPDGDDMLPREPAGALRVIERVLRAAKEVNGRVVPAVAVVISYAETVIPAGDLSSMSESDRTVLVTLLRWARSPEFVSVGPPVFLVTENLADIHPALRGASARVEAVHIPYPNEAEREEYIRAISGARQIPVSDVRRVAALTAGLKKVHIEDIFLRALAESRSVDEALVKARKEEIVRAEFAEVLELLDPEYGFEAVGGLETVKDFFYRNVINPIRTGNLRRVPLGVLLPGPPGTGKTLLAEAVARESGLNCARLNLAKIFDQWVGSTERHLEKALACLDALAPCLVIVDEIDQMGLARQNAGDSGVSNRVFKRLLEYMSDGRRRGKVVFVGLTNRPDLMDPALKRPGRFDRKVPVLPPNAAERAKIFEVVFRKYGIEYDLDLEMYAQATKGYTGAEIESLILKALEVAEDSGSAVVKEDHMQHACQAYIPTTRDIQAQVRLAIAECNDRDLLPLQYAGELDKSRVQLSVQPRAAQPVWAGKEVELQFDCQD